MFVELEDEDKLSLTLESLPPQLRYFKPDISQEIINQEEIKKETEKEWKIHESKVKRYIEESWLKKHLFAQENNFKKENGVSLYISTFNVNGKLPNMSSNEFESLLKPKNFVAEGNLPDVYVCGFQEIVELTKLKQVINDAVSKERSELWSNKVLSYLNEKLIPESLLIRNKKKSRKESFDLLGQTDFLQEKTQDVSEAPDEYVFLTEKHLVGISICIIVLKRHVNQINQADLISSYTATGVMGLFGNKGCVAVRLKLFSQTFCFISGHFAAHRENVINRNADYSKIMSKTTFKRFPVDDSAFSTAERVYLGDDYRALTTFNINDSDFIFFLGDFNYRMIASCPEKDVFDAVLRNNLGYLLENDQLVEQMKLTVVFQGFTEPHINFLPTYKYTPGTGQLDTANVYEEPKPNQKKKKVRVPAYCDRILYKQNFKPLEKLVKTKYYFSKSKVLMSDHFPVVGEFDCKVEGVDLQRRDQLFKKLYHVIHPEKSQVSRKRLNPYNRYNTDASPANLSGREVGVITYTPKYLNFPNLKYHLRSTTTLSIKNTSRRPIVFRLLPRKGSEIYLGALRLLKGNALTNMISYYNQQLTYNEAKAIVDQKSFGLIRNCYDIDIEAGIILPQETVNLKLGCFINKNTLRAVVHNRVSLRERLVLRVSSVHEEAFSDFEIPVVGELKSGTFGKSIDQLAQEDSTQQLPIPLQIWKLFNLFIEQNGFKDKNLFRFFKEKSKAEKSKEAKILQHIKTEVQLLRQSIDETETLPQVSNESIIIMLFEIFSLMKDPLVINFPIERYETDYLKAYQTLIRNLSKSKKNMFLYLLSFLKELLKNKQFNEVDPISLADLFSQLIFRPENQTKKRSLSRFLYTVFTDAYNTV
eukprot:snap_masked-scaffold_14-processed-gene-2.45-mRNA-1 protein AED:1.00 eAED:1.00 QI:0/0/0/0/1/1/2/0/871